MALLDGRLSRAETTVNASRFRLMLLACFLLAGGVSYGQEVIDSVDVGGWNVAGLTFNSSAGVVYGGCFYIHSNVFAIDCSSNAIVAQIDLPHPGDLAYAPVVNKAYCGFFNHGEDSILVIDGSSHSRIKAIPVPYAGNFEYDSVSNRLYFTCYSEDCVGVLDCWTDSVLGYIPIPGEPADLTINTRHRKLYCQNDANMTVSVIDMNTNQVIRNVHTGSWYFAQCYSAAADKYYTNGLRGVAVICGSGDTLIKQISLPQGYGPTAMVSVESESLVMVAAYSGGADSVYMVDVGADSIRSALRCGSSPRVLEYSSTSRVAYCANSGWDNLSVIAADGSRALSLLPVSDYPQDLLVCPPFEKLYVGHGGETNMLYIVRDRVGVSEPGESRPEAAGPRPATLVSQRYRYQGTVPAVLMDAAGRQVLRFKPGENDVSGLPTGVYMVVGREAGRPGKVVKME